MKWHNLSKLINDINKNIEDYKFSKMVVKKDGSNENVESIEKQNGVIRTNCMDCLDRTNVVQSVIARNVLLNQLYEVKIFNF